MKYAAANITDFNLMLYQIGGILWVFLSIHTNTMVDVNHNLKAIKHFEG